MEARSNAEALRSAAATGSILWRPLPEEAAPSTAAAEPTRVGEGGVVDDADVAAAAAADGKKNKKT